MRGQIISNWDKVDFDNPKHRAQLVGALQYFMALPDKFIPEKFEENAQFMAQHKEIRELHQAQLFTTTADFPTSILPVIEKFHQAPLYDNGYEAIFDVRDFSGSGRNGFDILDVVSGLTFKKVNPGGKVKVYQMSGTKEHVYFDFYGGALGWHRQLFDDREYWTIEDNAVEFRNKAYQFRASVFYALIEAVGAGANVAWQNPDPATLANTDRTYNANRDAQTINLAAQNIILNCANKGYGISAGNANFIVLVPLQLRGRIRKALGVLLDSFAGSDKHVDYSVSMITTTMLATTNVYYVILPKRRLKAGYRMDLTMFSDFDILSYSDVVAGWQRYGGAIGDTDQIARCAIS